MKEIQELEDALAVCGPACAFLEIPVIINKTGAHFVIVRTMNHLSLPATMLTRTMIRLSK